MKIIEFKKLQLWHKVLIGMLLGSVLGYFLDSDSFIIVDILDPIGLIFIRLLKMIVVPIIFFAILYGITSLSDAETFNRLGAKALVIYVITTILAVATGLLFAHFFEPGVGLELTIPTQSNSSDPNQSKSLRDILINVIPTNPIEAMAESNTLQVVVFAFFTGFALILVGEKGRVVKNFIISSTVLVFKMVELVIKLTPYAVFAIMATTVASYGLEIVIGLSKFILIVLSALFTQYCVFGFILIFIGRLNPFPFYKKMRAIQALAFATSSSKATLPTAILELRSKLGVSKQSSSFILPLGASMNMDATAIYLGISAVFFAQIIGVQLTIHQYMTIILTATIGSIGAAGFPGGGIIMMGMVLSSVGLPLEGIPLIIGVDRFLEMVRTAINITGDCAVTVIVDNMEGKLNKEVYYAPIENLNPPDPEKVLK